MQSGKQLLDDVGSCTATLESVEEVDEQSQDQQPIPAWLRYGFFGLAASLLTVLASQVLMGDRASNSPGYETAKVGARDASPDSSVVAKIIRKVDCDWEGDRWAVVSSSELREGQTLMMSRGLMELEFSSGARVTLEAPVSFRVVSAMRGVLSHGKLTANVPESAHGFTVSTPGGETIDLGTRFGLVVGPDGATETHVFEGQVVVRPALGESIDREVLLSEDMAYWVNGEHDEANSVPAAPRRFTSLSFDEEDIESPVSIDRDLKLWFSASQRLKVDEGGRVTAWGDLRTKSNQDLQNAWQVDRFKRPRVVQDAIDGNPAVRFEGRQWLVTEPLELGSSQSVAVVFRIDPALVDKRGVNKVTGRQLLNLNGPPHLVLAVNDRRHLVGRTYVGSVKTPKGGRGYVIAGRTISKQPLDDKPLMAISVYDPAAKSSRLYVNGKAVAKSGAKPMEATTSNRYIGSHMFLANTQFIGDIAELMIYDTGLTDDEAKKLSAAMMKKYAITEAPAGDLTTGI